MSKQFFLDDIDCPDLMTVSDLQHILHIGRNTAYHFLSSGQIQHLRVGRSIRIPRCCLLAYLQTTCYNKDTVTQQAVGKGGKEAKSNDCYDL